MFASFLTSKVVVWFLETALPFFFKYWKQVIVAAMAVWIVICCLSHCGTRTAPIETTVFVSDTVFEPDTAWHKLLGDTIAFYTAQLAAKQWEAPVLQFVSGATTADSLGEYKAGFEYVLAEMVECDSTYRTDYRFRSHTSILETDSFKLDYTINTIGILASPPVFKVQNKIPAKTITNTITKTVVLLPKRKVFLGFGGGGQGHALNNQFQGVVFKTEISYLDKKNNQFELEGQYSTQDIYSVLFTYKKGFDFGKYHFISSTHLRHLKPLSSFGV